MKNRTMEPNRRRTTTSTTSRPQRSRCRRTTIQSLFWFGWLGLGLTLVLVFGWIVVPWYHSYLTWVDVEDVLVTHRHHLKHNKKELEEKEEEEKENDAEVRTVSSSSLNPTPSRRRHHNKDDDKDRQSPPPPKPDDNEQPDDHDTLPLPAAAWEASVLPSAMANTTTSTTNNTKESLSSDASSSVEREQPPTDQKEEEEEEEELVLRRRHRQAWLNLPVAPHHDEHNTSTTDKNHTYTNHQLLLELIHIPKTGGTALEWAAAMQNVSWGKCHYKRHFRTEYLPQYGDTTVVERPKCSTARPLNYWQKQADVVHARHQSHHQCMPWHVPTCVWSQTAVLTTTTTTTTTRTNLSTFLPEPETNQTLDVSSSATRRLLTTSLDYATRTNPFLTSGTQHAPHAPHAQHAQPSAVLPLTPFSSHKLNAHNSHKGPPPTVLFAVVRHPYDRVVSEYKYVHRHNTTTSTTTTTTKNDPLALPEQEQERQRQQQKDDLNEWIAQQLANTTTTTVNTTTTTTTTTRTIHDTTNGTTPTTATATTTTTTTTTTTSLCDSSALTADYFREGCHWIPQTHYIFPLAMVTTTNTTTTTNTRTNPGTTITTTTTITNTTRAIPLVHAPRMVHHILLFEHLAQDLPPLLQWYKASYQAIQLPPKPNATTTSTPWSSSSSSNPRPAGHVARSWLTPENRQRIEDLYHWDFVVFGYEP